MNETIKIQFKQYIENHITNPLVEDKKFDSYDRLGEHDFIFLTVEKDNVKYLYEYNCYQVTESNNYYDFIFFRTETV